MDAVHQVFLVGSLFVLARGTKSTPRSSKGGPDENRLVGQAVGILSAVVLIERVAKTSYNHQITVRVQRATEANLGAF